MWNDFVQSRASVPSGKKTIKFSEMILWQIVTVQEGGKIMMEVADGAVSLDRFLTFKAVFKFRT